MCKEFGWGNSRLRTFLNLLQEDGMIKTHSSTKATWISICKYDTYQELHKALVFAVKYNGIIWKCCVNDEKAGNKMEDFRKGLDLLIEYFKIK